MRLVLVLVVGLAWSQVPVNHSVTLTWLDAANPAGTTYSIYRATGLCSGNPAFSKIANAIAEKTYEDATVQPGNYCYQVTATLNNVESGPSNTALAPVPSWAPTQLSVTVK